MNRSHPRHGFTLVEVMVALVVLTIAGIGVMDLLARGQSQNHRRRSVEAALHIARNEVERVQAGDPRLVPTSAAWTHTDETGTPAAEGTFRVRVSRTTACDAVAAVIDDSGSGAAPPCAGAIPQVEIAVEHAREGAWTRLVTRTVRDAAIQPSSGSWAHAGAS